MSQTNNEYPKFFLKNIYKQLILQNGELQNTVRKFYGKGDKHLHLSTLYRWINEDYPEMTDYNLLYIVWDYAQKNQPNLKIRDLISLKK